MIVLGAILVVVVESDSLGVRRGEVDHAEPSSGVRVHYDNDTNKHNDKKW